MTAPIIATDHTVLLRSLRRELDIRLDALMTGDPIDPASIPDLCWTIGSAAMLALVEVDAVTTAQAAA